MGSIDIVQRLANYEPSILVAEVTDHQHMTPLHMAAKGMHSSIVQYLLDEVRILHRDIKGQHFANWVGIVGAVIRSLLSNLKVPSSIPAPLRFEYMCNLLFRLS